MPCGVPPSDSSKTLAAEAELRRRQPKYSKTFLKNLQWIKIIKTAAGIIRASNGYKLIVFNAPNFTLGSK